MDLQRLINSRNAIWKDYLKYYDPNKNEVTIPYPHELDEIEKKIYQILKFEDENLINEIVLKNCWIKRKMIYK